MTKYFSDTCNVLSHIWTVEQFPYPHSYTSICLPNAIYQMLSDSLPPWQAIAGEKLENNVRKDLSACALLKSKTLAPIWKDFIEYHTSHDFYLQILDRFEKYFMEFYPQLGNLRDYKTAVRFGGEKADIYLDCQLSINTPVTEKSTVSVPHVDSPLELFASLLYMKQPDDDAGGDLVLQKAIRSPMFHGKRRADLDCVRDYKTIPYAPNTYVCFVNSPLSIHSVTEREVTDKPRWLVNISLEFMDDAKPLFKVMNDTDKVASPPEGNP